METVAALAGEGLLLSVLVEGWKEPALVHPENRKLLKDAIADKLKPELTTLLSPFDPLVWDRARARVMFDFDYRLECYTPAPKRRYGYFTLPILHKGTLAGRLDAKAHRKDGLFEVKSLHLEPHARVNHEMVAGLAGAIKEFAGWHKTPSVVVRLTEPASLAKRLSNSINAL
jgi:uncharacterized protein YcaQ